MMTTIRYILLTALRDWLFLVLALVLLAVFGVGYFLGNTSIEEQQQAILVYTASSMRVVLHIGLVVFVGFHVQRMFDNKEIDVILTRPVTRTQFVLSYFFGFATITALLVLLPMLLIGLLLSPNPYGFMLWSLSLLLEGWIVAAFTMFAALIMKNAVTSVLLAYGFYAVSRMMGFLLYYTDPGVNPAANYFELITKKLLLVLSIFLPRLDQFSLSEWLIYGIEPQAIDLFALQAAVYIPFLLMLALADFKRKQF